MNSVTAEVWGGGGSGGAATGNPSTGGGGAGGCYAIKILSVTPGTSYTVTVGTGGTASTSAGAAGNDSWFNTSGTVIAKGGAAGGTGSTNNGNGSGGTGSSTACIGDTVFAGGSGSAGVVATPVSGSGGGGAGSTGAGGNASGGTAGTGTSTGGGNGGAGVTTANTQNNGSTRGGGGSGAYASGAADRAGGNGGDGAVVLTWNVDPGLGAFPFTQSGNQKFEAKRIASPRAGFTFTPALSTAPATVFIAGQTVDPGVLLGFQYDSQAEPLIPLAAPGSAPFIDVHSVRPRARTRSAIDRAFSFAPPAIQINAAIYIPGSNPVPASVYGFQYPDEASPVITPAPSSSETLTLDKWVTRSPDPVRRQRRLMVYGNNTAVAKQEIPTMEWAEQPGLPRRARQRLKDYSFRSFDTTATAPSTPAIYVSGMQVTPSVLQSFQYDDLARPPLSITGAGETITLNKWGPTQPVLRRIRRSISEGSAYVKVAPFGDLITLGKWLSYQPAQFPKRRTIEGQFRLYVIPILTIPPSSAPALWRNEATISLFAADLASIGLTIEDVQLVSVMAVSLAEDELITSNSALVTLTTKDEQSITILYEDVKTI